MLTRTLGRLGAAAVLAAGLLVATAAPAPAVVHNVEITPSSQIRVHVPANTTTATSSTDTASIHYTGHATTNVCAPNSVAPTPFAVDFNSTGGGTVTPTTTSYGDFVVGANTFKVRLNIVSGTVTLSATGVSVTLTVNAEFRNCASTTLLCRTNNIAITMTGANPTGTHHPSTSTTFAVTGTSAPITLSAVPACNVILRAALLGNVAIANLTLHVISS